MAVDRDGNIIDPFNLRLDTDPKMLRDAMAQYDSLSGVTRPGMPSTPPEMTTPQFAPIEYAEAGELPSLNLDLTNILDLSEQMPPIPPDVRTSIIDETEAVINNAQAGDVEDGIRAVGALALDNAPGLIEEKEDAYRNLSDIIDAGGLPAVEEFVRSMYTDGDNKENIPEWALPAAVFGTFMMNEPGDWRQAYLQAKGKTATYMFNKRNADATAKAQLEKEIKEKALELYQSREIKTNDLLSLVGKVTPASLKTFQNSGKIGDLVLVDEQESKENLLDNFTAASVGRYQQSGDYNDLVRLSEKDDKDTKIIEYLKLFTPASVAEYEKGGRQDSSVLVRKAGSKDQDLSELTGLLEEYTPASVEEFKQSDYNFNLLVPKTDNGFVGGDAVFGDSSDGIMMNNITNMIKTDYIEKLKTADLDTKLDQLNIYAGLYKATTDTQITKTGALDTLKQRQPFVNVTPKEYAERIGLDLNDPNVAELAKIPVNLLPTAPKELATSYLANKSLRNKMEIVGNILKNAPENVVGVKGELLGTDVARILSDVTGFSIPAEYTLSKILLNVAEIDLIEGIIKEDRFTEQDRRMVREFIKGDNYKTQAEALLRLEEVMEIIDRTDTVLMNQLEGNYRPIETMSIEERSLDNKSRVEELLKLSKP
jgi:hypothetical protein